MKKVLFVGMAVLIAACSGNNSFTTEEGIEVNYIEKGDGELPSDSLISIYYMSYSTDDGKELMKVNPNNPLPLKINQTSKVTLGELYPILSKLKVGDSVHFKIGALDLFTKTFKAAIPDSISAESNIEFKLAYLDQMTKAGYQEMMEKKAEEFAAKQIKVDSEILDNYMTENNIDAEVTDSGLRYVITEQGSGTRAEAGKTVHVAYVGRTLEGVYFDTSIKEIAEEKGMFNLSRKYEPYSFVLGQGRVIKGWDEGIELLNEGTKATLYIPSPLGYGARGSGQHIKPNSILVFDVELVKVEK